VVAPVDSSDITAGSAEHVVAHTISRMEEVATSAAVEPV
jgi:hypothetical protein